LLRFLAIHAHPDDIEFQCAGTLALLKRKGHQITLATLTAGDCGSAELAPSEIARIRREEARKAAELLGADYFCLEFEDLRIVDDDRSRMRVTEVLRQVAPDVVITAPPIDYMTDHENTSRLVRQATFNAPIPNYTTGADHPARPIDAIPHLYYVDPLEGTDYFGRDLPADFYVDVTETFAIKKEMLACHASQRDWLLRQHGIDEYLEAQKRWSQKRGHEAGCPFAEAFCQHRGHPYPQDNILGELLREVRYITKG
jgi:LmbE family N-acetylglucosaminyl deacetylase